MKIVIALFLTALMFIGCSSKETTEAPMKAKLVVESTLALELNDQNEKAYSLEQTTKKVIFAFSKDVGHVCNDFFATKSATYLEDNNAVFVADVSSAPSLIRSMFILPGLKEFKHKVLVLDDENMALSYKENQNTEKIVIAVVENKIIKTIKSISTIAELEKEIKN